MLIGTSVRDPGIDSIFDRRPESFLLEPDTVTLLFGLSEVVLDLRQDRCFFGLDELFVQFLFGSANTAAGLNPFATTDLGEYVRMAWRALAVLERGMFFWIPPSHFTGF
jgi:hypothetical protein